MLKIEQLSFWEKESYFSEIDFLIIGAGIVGLSTAIELRTKYKDAKIVVLERSYLSAGASTKNAGFTCFGSPTELLSDLNNTSENEVISLVQKRVEGLDLLLSRLNEKINYLPCGSFEVFTEKEHETFNTTLGKLDQLNALVSQAINKTDVYRIAHNKFGFSKVVGLIENRLEGQIDTGKMILELTRLAQAKNCIILNGFEVKNWVENDLVSIDTNFGKIETKELVVCTNGLSHLLPLQEDIQPARAQVLITKPIENLNWSGTFHYDEGYYYFRNVKNRILIGGARNLALKEENTSNFATTQQIETALTAFLKNIILPQTDFEIEHKWSGIMGVGQNRNPIVKKISKHIRIGIKLGGMGVALGSLVGKELAEL